MTNDNEAVTQIYCYDTVVLGLEFFLIHSQWGFQGIAIKTQGCQEQCHWAASVIVALTLPTMVKYFSVVTAKGGPSYTGK